MLGFNDTSTLVGHFVKRVKEIKTWGGGGGGERGGTRKKQEQNKSEQKK